MTTERPPRHTRPALPVEQRARSPRHPRPASTGRLRVRAASGPQPPWFTDGGERAFRPRLDRAEQPEQP
ncbi:hypothetical protein [Streptomyces hirsutus]|uniref:hypothetical protein n=1 Tax=Streptomyces hirsutus TaxID=35620 RepID=UPI0036B9885E